MWAYAFKERRGFGIAYQSLLGVIIDWIIVQQIPPPKKDPTNILPLWVEYSTLPY